VSPALDVRLSKEPFSISKESSYLRGKYSSPFRRFLCSYSVALLNSYFFDTFLARIAVRQVED
jgi:hypothetical protein